MAIRVRVPDTRRVPDPTDMGTEMIFYPQVTPVPNPMGTRYFTTAIILGCEQVKMCSFYYINYDLI
jgi:hypothetical protein